MAGISDHPARGTIVEQRGDTIVFRPLGTTYQLHLERAFDGSVEVGGRPVRAILRARARKIWTVPSGGLFVAPIFGSPRTIQGRVRYIDEHQIVVDAGTTFVLELPGATSALDLANGPIAVGTLVNVTAMPGATLDIFTPAGAQP
jgi:hypothetical protein